MSSGSGARLYHVAVPGFVHSRAFRCIWLLEELGVSDYEVCLLDPGQPYAPQMRARGVQHSHKVPTLEWQGQEIGDSGIISLLLAEHHNALLGLPEERIERLQWVAMAETCISFRIPLLPTLMAPDQSLETLQRKAVDPMRAVFRGNVERFESHLQNSERKFLLASGFSMADTMCGWSLHTLHSWGIMDLSLGDSPLTLDYLERLRQRPGFIAAEQYAGCAPGLYRQGELLEAH
ncbi:MAG: glutathione S-transferase family protein [Pseudomonadota bacterium]